MKKKTYSQVLDDIAHGQVPADLDLAPQIMARAQKGKQFSMKSRKSLLTAVLLISIAFVVLFFTAPVVAAAIQRWFGYVPGFGLVRDGQLRELAEPVNITQNGFTLRVDQTTKKWL
jgi:hypothetical protein